MPSQDPEALADRSPRSLISSYATVLRVWCLWHLQTTSILCPIDYHIIWFSHKTLFFFFFFKLKDSDKLIIALKMCLYYYGFIIGSLNGISKFSQLLIVRAHDDKVKSPSVHFHMVRSQNQQHFPSSLPKWFPREAARSEYSQSSCILWHHSCLTRQELLPLDFLTDFRDCLRWIFIVLI